MIPDFLGSLTFLTIFDRSRRHASGGEDSEGEKCTCSYCMWSIQGLCSLVCQFIYSFLPSSISHLMVHRCFTGCGPLIVSILRKLEKQNSWHHSRPPLLGNLSDQVVMLEALPGQATEDWGAVLPVLFRLMWRASAVSTAFVVATTTSENLKSTA